MSILESLAHIAGFLGFILSLSVWLANRESYYFDDVRYSFCSFDLAMGLVISFNLCNRSSRPVTLTELSVILSVGEWDASDGSLAFLPPDRVRPLLAAPWASPFAPLQEIPATVPPNTALRMCAVFVSRSSNELLDAAARQRNAACQAAPDPISRFHKSLEPTPGSSMILCSRSFHRRRSFRVQARFQPLSASAEK